ncbi:RED-like protein N-terminal region-domain-containing protein [Absidia repens]|uniref:RED-like protein N-terminal region-domain-containing protein n=1 Tax=Absidia repens TaxID=90262 RepID=A0A1X2IH28_9FUNG|nr:RED-like protein N-terminal region-domain-containing protein [Absidia repens]
MANDGLSQEDFRKLLQTPRPGSDTSFTSTPKFKAPAPKAPRNEGSAVFAKPKSIKYKKKRTQGADDQDKLNYRDRAAERRVGENEPSSDQQTTEDLLRPMEQDEALDAQQVYEQSKYLGGDIQHTHLVKGLDFTLLNKVRRQIHEKNSSTSDDEDEDNDMEQADEMENGNNIKSAMVMDEQAEDALDNALDRLARGEKAMDEGSAPTMKDVSHLSATAKALDNIFKHSTGATGDNNNNKINATSLGTSHSTPLVYELFRPGRMAFLFPAATKTSIDSFTIPTAVIRSKADINERQQQSSQASGWSDEALQESELVLSKVSQVMARSRQQQQLEQQKAKQLEEQRNLKLMAASQVSPPSPKNDMEDDSDDNLIFSDVEGDYVLDESTIEKQKQQEPPSDENAPAKRTNYFMDNDQDDNDVTMDQSTETSAMVSEMMESTAAANGGDMVTGGGQKRKYELGPEESIDTDSQDMDMFGLSTTALPTSFTDRQRMTVMDDEDDEGGDGDDKRSMRHQQATLLVDQGTHKNKKAQLSRWDFDDEEQWQHYKSTVEIQPKSAAQFGVKMGDGRKRNKERRTMTDKQKLNREYQQVKGIMDKKYGKS